MLKPILFLLAVLLISCTNSIPEQKDNIENEIILSDSTLLVEIKLDVNGMTCEGCENSIKSGLKNIEGVTEVTASHTDCNVVVKADSSKVNRQIIAKAITEIGYEVVNNKIK